MTFAFDTLDALGPDWRTARWIGRIDRGDGPTPVIVAGGIVFDMSKVAPTVAELVARDLLDPTAGEAIGDLDTLGLSVGGVPRLLSPIDVQCVKAAGVTFAVSALERVIEEQARGDAGAATAVRARLEDRIGGGLARVVPGTPEAAALKTALIEEGLWSQYLEVAIGPDAEIFTKAPSLSTVGWGADIGVRSDSTWNNPEPEIVLLVAPDARIVGATIKAGETAEYTLGAGHHAYLVPATGAVEINGVTLNARDGAAIKDESVIRVTATADSEFVLVDAA